MIQNETNDIAENYTLTIIDEKIVTRFAIRSKTQKSNRKNASQGRAVRTGPTERGQCIASQYIIIYSKYK